MARVLLLIDIILVLALAACGGGLPAWHHPQGYGEDRLVADLQLCHVQALTESSSFTTTTDVISSTGKFYEMRGVSAPHMVQTVDDELYDAAFKKCMTDKGWVEGRGPKATVAEQSGQRSKDKSALPSVEAAPPPSVLPLEQKPELHWDTGPPPEADIPAAEDLTESAEEPEAAGSQEETPTDSFEMPGDEAVGETSDGPEGTGGESPGGLEEDTVQEPMAAPYQEDVTEPDERTAVKGLRESAGEAADEHVEGILEESEGEDSGGLSEDATEEVVEDAGEEASPAPGE